MALESATYVGDLVITNPLGADGKNLGDDHLRLIKNVLRESFAGFTGSVLVSGTDGGGADAYTLTPTTALLAYGTKMIVEFTPNATNTGASTLNISALGAKNIYTVEGAALAAGDLVSGQTYIAAYDGTRFRLLSIIVPLTPVNAKDAASKQYVDASVTPTGSVSVWVTGTTYAYGYEVFSPIDFQTYRRKVAGAGTTDPSLDTTNWTPVNLFSSGIIITAGAVREHKAAIAASAIDISLANYFTKTITATTTFTVSNVTATGTVSSFILDLTNGGSQTINWWSGVKWASATAPTLTASGRDVLGFFTHDGGTVWTGMLLTKDAR